MKHYFIIQDWAANILDFKGRFTRPELAVPKEFATWDDAEDYLSELLGDAYETDRGEYYIIARVV